MLTGVTKFGQVSVFSDLNQLLDLSLHPDYGALCGITEPELLQTFAPELAELARRNGVSDADCIERVRRRYDGYRFEENAPRVYNPFSTLNLLHSYKFQDFWFQTGTPTFLVELLKRCDTDVRDLDGVTLSPDDFANYRADPNRPLPVIYQSGYLTIRDYDQELGVYTLGYPNEEVRHGFLHFLLPHYTGIEREGCGAHIVGFIQDLRAGNVNAFMTRLRAFFAGIP